MLVGTLGRFKATYGVTKVAENVLWIGVNDWDAREFHSMEVSSGTSYNSYLIEGNVPTIVDAVKYTLADEWIERLVHATGGLSKIKYIVMNHAEPDHSSGIVRLMEKAPHIELVCTQLNFDTLSRFYKSGSWKKKIIKSGEPFKLGNTTLVLAGVPMAHWPESGVTYYPEKKILFSNDAFGQHIASNRRFLDEIPEHQYRSEAKSYYANILQRLGRPVQNALKALGGLDIKMVLPSHGVGLRTPEDIKKAIGLYSDWAAQKPQEKVMVIYDCNWFGSEKLGHAVANGVGKTGVHVDTFHARRTHITRTATEALDSAGIAIGSAVLHENVLPDLAMHLQYLRALGIKDKLGVIFGTYGWTEGTVPKEVRAQLFTPTKTKEVCEPVLAKWHPDDSQLEAAEQLGVRLGEAVIAKLRKQ